VLAVLKTILPFESIAPIASIAPLSISRTNVVAVSTGAAVVVDDEVVESSVVEALSVTLVAGS
jgi:hypothetical protein